jgi:hypothetical protein
MAVCRRSWAYSDTMAIVEHLEQCKERLNNQDATYL